MGGYGKMTVLVVLLSLVWLPASCPEGNEAVGLELFHRWMVKHRRVYTQPEEKATRYANFLRNIEFVRMRNAATASGGSRVGLNVFADFSNEEFKEMYSSRALKSKAALEREGRKRLMESAERRVAITCDVDVPTSLDWRKKGAVTAVKDQGQCGGCWAFSSTGAMEGINAITTGELISLSEQELIDCDTSNDGCNGGYMDYAFEWVTSNGGIDTEQNYPYTGVDSVCNTTKEDIKVVSIDGYRDVSPSDIALLCAVVQQPISVGIDGSSLDFQLYTGGIYNGDCSSNPDDIDHAVLIVGYGQEKGIDYWITKNSWGTNWGMEGYIYIERNTTLPYGICAINAMASYPTKQSSSHTAGPPTPLFVPPQQPTPPFLRYVRWVGWRPETH
ncbi:hypothetical protein Taro_012100 [Colocasia esculenta]|uniref:Uncharacterized protein n=1 Tax=Colocasia esculenta TaxID=4460 RepID=A0A843UCN8_COLES|nr:hypothetical protein [Colocasia esculenta]